MPVRFDNLPESRAGPRPPPVTFHMEPRTLVIHDKRYRDARAHHHISIGQLVSGQFDRIIVRRRLGPSGRAWFSAHIWPRLARGGRVTFCPRCSPLPRN